MSAAGAAWGNLMKHPAFSIRPGNTLRNSLVRALLFSIVAVLFFAGVTPAQKQKKKKGQDDQKNSSGILPPLPDDRAIDMTISEMLGAWQIGDPGAGRRPLYQRSDLDMLDQCFRRTCEGGSRARSRRW